ncbi:solute carrier family 32 (vesicular inhibitory amino acid transporter) [Cryptococcus wingfieldii CBS 7118]|uniref:Solute carrier family 32 (Vesicular inhibitory amino acid transporter) n=1 Tax=Cryptococcus wingfieldii CBS 7118 TaxID=1295528 RepID=A0A1E3JBY9_9TREE|nr:solute carrier family 32 (vesicular inhibitory amino acid transporter) [Cryptococcus wingfieldii CBS 7118]ODN98398.1 solute carrier family 32 (vesicular inhibitory amino acid transporter) [Cryptococcus wingfieldii CBS 7118]
MSAGSHSSTISSQNHGISLAASSATLVEPSESTPLLHGSESIKGNISQEVYSDCEEEAEGREVDVYVPGQATFNQTLLNVLGDLIGTGLLACPIAIAHAGWVFGPLILCAVCGITLWTLKILVRIIEKDRSMRNFADVARYGLGPRSEKWIAALFISDCCIWMVALIVLFSDSFEVVLPMLSSNQWKVVGLAVIVPLNFIPLRYLSWTSALGIISTWTLVAILIFTGLATPTSPGSIWHPAPTDLWPVHGPVKFGLSFGLLISGFGGHFLVPNLIRDMKHPEQGERVCEVGYGICIVVYALVSVFGYLMFGRDVSDEISRDLAKTSAFSPLMASIAVWMVAINPLTKIPLGLRPLTDVVYSFFNLQPTIFVPKAHSSSASPTIPKPNPNDLPSSPSSSVSSTATLEDPHYLHALSNAQRHHDRRETLKSVFRALVAICLLAFFVAGALVFPSFETLLSIMGGGMSVVTSILIPIAAGANLWGWSWYSRSLFGISSVVCVIGLLCALLNNQS